MINPLKIATFPQKRKIIKGINAPYPRKVVHCIEIGVICQRIRECLQAFPYSFISIADDKPCKAQLCRVWQCIQAPASACSFCQTKVPKVLPPQPKKKEHPAGVLSFFIARTDDEPCKAQLCRVWQCAHTPAPAFSFCQTKVLQVLPPQHILSYSSMVSSVILYHIFQRIATISYDSLLLYSV